jgi:hypothetical protein
MRFARPSPSVSALTRAVALLPFALGLGSAALPPPSATLDAFLRLEPAACQPPDGAVAVEIDAALPKLKKHGTMSGLRLISRSGKIVYRSLQFTGDALIKTSVIARFLTADTQPPERPHDSAITQQNYTFRYRATDTYNGAAAYAFILRPKRKRMGLFKGELWLDAKTGVPLREWGEFAKSPSLFIRSAWFVRDYEPHAACSEPRRLILRAQTRIAGAAEMTIWWHATTTPPSE